MIPTLPVLDQALRDPTLAALDLKVLLTVAEDLDVEGWSPVKEVAIRRTVGIGRTRLYQAFRALVDAGYLLRRAGGPGQVSEYKLPYRVRQHATGDAAC